MRKSANMQRCKDANKQFPVRQPKWPFGVWRKGFGQKYME